MIKLKHVYHTLLHTAMKACSVETAYFILPLNQSKLSILTQLRNNALPCRNRNRNRNTVVSAANLSTT